LGKKLDKTAQKMIWDKSKDCSIGQIANQFNISRPTAKKYMNPEYI